MTSVISAPEDVDDIPSRIGEAYMAAGAPFSPDDAAVIVAHWFEKSYGRYAMGWSIPEAIKSVVGRFGRELNESIGYGQWIPALNRLLKGAIEPELDRIIRERLLVWLVPVMSFKELYSLHLGDEPKEIAKRLGVLPRFIPRSMAECDDIIDAIHAADSDAVKMALMLLLGKGCREHNPFTKEKVTRLIAEFLDRRPDLFMNISDKYAMRAGSMKDILEPVDDPDLLCRLMRLGDRDLMRGASWWFDHNEAREDWSMAYDIARKHPLELSDAFICRPDETLLEIFRASDDDEIRKNAVELLFRSVQFREFKTVDGRARHPVVDMMIAVFKRWWGQDGDMIRTYYNDSIFNRFDDYPTGVLARLWDLGTPEVRDWVATGFLSHIKDHDNRCRERTDDSSRERDERESDDIRGFIKEAAPRMARGLKAWHEDHKDYDDTGSGLESILRRLPPGEAHHFFPALMEIAVGRQGGFLFFVHKTARQVIVEYLRGLDPRVLVDGGWLTARKKKVRDVGFMALLGSEDPEAEIVLIEALNFKSTGDVDKGRILDRLEELGRDVGDLDSTRGYTLADWQKKVASGRLKSIPKELAGDPALEPLEPLGERLVRYYVAAASEIKEGRLPRFVREITGLPGDETGLTLAERLFDFWVANNGRPKFTWVLNFVCEYGDDRFVLPLKRAIRKWCKKAKPSANAAIRALGRLGSTYAMTLLKEISDANRFSESLVVNANRSLDAALKRKGISREEMAEELIPDFGMRPDGLWLDLGPREVCVKVEAGLNPRIHHETGKITKTFPKCKKDEDPILHKAARGKFNILKKNVKPVVQRQRTLMKEFLMVAHYYTSARWRRIYQEHPLMAHLFQGVIWSRAAGTDAPSRGFRVSEDLSLIDADSQEVELGADDRIALWHPIVSEAGEKEAWQAHFEEYELEDMLGQLSMEIFRPEGAEGRGSQVTRFEGRRMSAPTLKNILKRLGYSGDIGDGGYISSHGRQFNNGDVSVGIEHGRAASWYEKDEEVELEYLSVSVSKKYRRMHGLKEGSVASLDELPPVLVSNMIAQIASLAAKGEAPTT